MDHSSNSNDITDCLSQYAAACLIDLLSSANISNWILQIYALFFSWVCVVFQIHLNYCPPFTLWTQTSKLAGPHCKLIHDKCLTQGRDCLYTDSPNGRDCQYTDLLMVRIACTQTHLSPQTWLVISLYLYSRSSVQCLSVYMLSARFSVDSDLLTHNYSIALPAFLNLDIIIIYSVAWLIALLFPSNIVIHYCMASLYPFLQNAVKFVRI